MRTPFTEAGLRKFDHLSADRAALMAWTEPGAQPKHHEAMRKRVRREMPLLARALDRMADERRQFGGYRERNDREERP